MIIFEPIIPENRLNMYNWQHKNWPQFEFDYTSLDVNTSKTDPLPPAQCDPPKKSFNCWVN